MTTATSDADSPAAATQRRVGPWPSGLGSLGLATVLGVPWGIAWYLLAPRITFEVRDDGVFASEDAPTDWFGVDGWFIVVGLVLGVAAGLIAYWRWRQHPVAALLGLAVGGLLAGWLGLQVGRLLGPASIGSDALDSPDGTIIPAPLDVLATGSLLVLGFAAVLAFGLMVALERAEPATDEPATDEPEET